MKKLLFTLFILPVGIFAQEKPPFNRITEAKEGLYYMYYEGSSSKSIIVEFKSYIALLEVPIKDEGGSAQKLQDHIEEGERVLNSLANYFPKKPLKYLLHSHWHPHSISAVSPFLAKGVQLISTKSSFEKMRAFVTDETIAKYQKQIQWVETDSLVIADKTNKIVAYRLENKDFPNVPTSEYLYFFLPKYQTMLCGCMYLKWEGEPVGGKPIITGREGDLYKFIASRHLKPQFLVRLQKEEGIAEMHPFQNLENTIATGIKAQDIADKLREIPLKTLQENQDSLIQHILTQKYPISILNSLAYSYLRIKNFDKALAFAKMQVLLKPDDPNSWDTLGEVHYFRKEETLARKYAQQAKIIDPNYQEGGVEVWQKDLEEYQKKW
jgi:tetratricopeptide (TPR) repeat protein